MPRKTQIKTTAKTVEKSECHIHKEVGNVEAVEIREKVCVQVNDYPLIKHTDDNYYCLFHLPTSEKDIVKFESIFKDRLQKVFNLTSKIENLSKEQKNQLRKNALHDFRYVWFPSWVNLSELIFESNVDFSYATFFQQVDFWSSIFNGTVNFNSATFNDAAKFHWETKFNSITYFGRANFNDLADFNSAFFEKGVSFDSAHFDREFDFSSAKSKQDVTFIKTTFKDAVYFTSTIFEKDALFREATIAETADILFLNTNAKGMISFYYTEINGHISFQGDNENDIFVGENAYLDIEARIKDKDKILFNSVRLQPGWFINVDSRKFVFTACRWKKSNGQNIDVKSEFKTPLLAEDLRAHKLLTKACWYLAENHEEMKSFSRASWFRQIANDSKRLEDYYGWKVWSLHWWYWLSSFYGESPLRAGVILAGIILLFAVAFMSTGFQVCPMVKTTPEIPCKEQALTIWQSALQSLATATFQNIEYIKPNSMTTTFLIILEKILAPLQAALLALAIRRKFMR